VIPAKFEYEVAGSVEEAVDLLGAHEDAKLLAGGHSLIPAMKLRIARPAMLVDIGGIGDLSYVREDGDAIAIGALTRHHDVAVSDLLREKCGIVAGAAAEIGDPQVRHRGTIGGSVSHGDPASDMPGVLLALDAEFVVVGPGGERRIRAAEFFTGVFETALGEQDVLTEIRVPATSLAGSAPSSAFSAAAAGSAPPVSACSAADARSGVPPMLTRPTLAPPFAATAATPTVAQSCLRRANLRYAQPPEVAGTRISVSTSCSPSAVSKTPVKNSVAGTVR